MNRLFLITLVALLPLTIGADTRKVYGEYTYYSDPNMSPKEAMAAAIENARVQAMAKEFGMLISQSTISIEDMDSQFFSQLSASGNHRFR